jgi:LPS sulfotransferase NodH
MTICRFLFEKTPPPLTQADRPKNKNCIRPKNRYQAVAFKEQNMTDPMTGSNSLPEVTQADREAGWPFAHFHCLPDRQMRERWFAGYYDKSDEGAIIQVLARHRSNAIDKARTEALEEAERAAWSLSIAELAEICPMRGGETEVVWIRRAIRDAIRALKESGQ